MSTRERAKSSIKHNTNANSTNKVKIVGKKPPSCSFCMNSKFGHSKETNCPMRKHYQANSVEHAVGSRNDDCADHITRRIEHDKLFKQSRVTFNPITAISTNNKHLIMQSVWQTASSDHPAFQNDMVFEISIINKFGETNHPLLT